MDNLFSACGEDADGFVFRKIIEENRSWDNKEISSVDFFLNHFKVIGPDGKQISLTDNQKKEFEHYTKMLKTHTPELIKMRLGGTKVVWRLK